MMIYPSQINKIQLAMSSKQRVHFIDLLFTMYGPMGNKWVTIFIANWVIYIYIYSYELSNIPIDNIHSNIPIPIAMKYTHSYIYLTIIP